MAVATYNPAGMSLSIAGLPPHGLDDGTFLSIRRRNPLFEAVEGADGEVARIQNPGAMGDIVLTLLQTSTFNAVLSALAESDRASGAGIVPFLLSEGSTVIAAGETWVEELPEVTYSKSKESREWHLAVAKFSAFHVGGNS